MLDRREAMTGIVTAGLLTTPATAITPASDTQILAAYTQSLLEAITRGDGAYWARMLADDVVITDESGNVTGKAELVASFRPFPPRITGNIMAQDFKARISGDTAITTYISDEHEGFYGANIHCQYRTTDTWQRRAGEWKLIASQVLALRTDPPAIVLPRQALASVAGRYALAPDRPMVVTMTDTGLTMAAGTRPARPFLAEARDVFFQPGNPRYRYVLERDAQGAVIAIIERREAWDLRYARTTS